MVQDPVIIGVQATHEKLVLQPFQDGNIELSSHYLISRNILTMNNVANIDKKRSTLPLIATWISSLSSAAPHLFSPTAEFVYGSRIHSHIFRSHLKWLLDSFSLTASAQLWTTNLCRFSCKNLQRFLCRCLTCQTSSLRSRIKYHNLIINYPFLTKYVISQLDIRNCVTVSFSI